ncbi:uncharacterized protein F5891DRAFT_1254035 [Suillus fuscotomentosus]|uniref:MI domain-containing protein n=1 Tax=Suillus fuscotomentosus TaxID=1912939 RepID=A0AAD4HBG5_9AGAM|nr:uncharacterized protein F5891DRAFT_1254035 [Suillus fuscotomentosus]KAG1879955.1 hypothetical protein F5891DRAFT_1254035 [Suillus fuscotomentosus]
MQEEEKERVRQAEEFEKEPLCQEPDLEARGRLTHIALGEEEWKHSDFITHQRVKELGNSLNVSSHMQFMPQDVIDLRGRVWLAVKEIAAADKESFNRQISMSRSGSRRGDHWNQEHGPDGWAVMGGNSVPWAPPQARDLSQFGKIFNGPAMGMVMCSSGVFMAGKKDSKQETLSRTNSVPCAQSEPEFAAKASTKPGRWSSRKLNCRRLLDQLLSRSVHTTEEHATTPSEEEPSRGGDLLTNLLDEHRFRLVDKLLASALESKEADVRLVTDFFAQATNNRQCALEVIEGGFMPMAEFSSNIVIDALKAFDCMTIILEGAGFENDPGRLQ